MILWYCNSKHNRCGYWIALNKGNAISSPSQTETSRRGLHFVDLPAGDGGQHSMRDRTPRCESRTCSRKSGYSAFQNRGCRSPKSLSRDAVPPPPVTHCSQYLYDPYTTVYFLRWPTDTVCSKFTPMSRAEEGTPERVPGVSHSRRMSPLADPETEAFEV